MERAGRMLGSREVSHSHLLCEEELRVSAEDQGEGSWIGGLRRRTFLE